MVAYSMAQSFLVSLIELCLPFIILIAGKDSHNLSLTVDLKIALAVCNQRLLIWKKSRTLYLTNTW
jgi:hypothetical protein